MHDWVYSITDLPEYVPPIILRFCLSNVIAYGQTFLDLVLHISAYIRNNMKISFEVPDPSWRTYASRVLKMSLSKRLQGAKDKGAQHRQKLTELMDRYLVVFNGDWRDTRPQGLTHYCHVQCGCGGLRPEDLAQLASSTFIELAMFSRPPIPALSRWLKCSETAKWYLSAS